MSLLETIIHDLKKCPICDAYNSFKISGLIGKNLECTRCKAKWSAGTYDDGGRWLMLTNPSNTKVGTVKSGLIWRQSPLDFWQNKNKPFLKLERYAEAIYEVFKDFEFLKKEFGEAEFKDGKNGIWFIGPSIHIVATINIFWEKKKEDYDLTIGVVDQTLLLKDKDKLKDSLFCYMIRKKLHIFSEETGIPITPYSARSWKEGGKEVKENSFYPFKDLEEIGVTFPAGTPKWHRDMLVAYAQMEPFKEKKKLFEAKPAKKIDAKPAKKIDAKPAKKIDAKPAKKTPQKFQIAKQKRASRDIKCATCGSLMSQGTIFCPNCRKLASSPDKQMITIYIDESHKEITALDNFKTFKAQLEEKGKVLVHSKKPLTTSSLRGKGLLIIGGPDNPWIFGRGADKWESKEVRAIEQFVSWGGALLMMGYGSGSAEKMNVVTAPFGIAFSGDFVGDETIFKEAINPNPITEEVNEFCLGSVLNGGGKYLEVKEPAVVLAEHEGRPVLAYSEHENGRVVVLSSCPAFSNKYFEKNDNRTLLENILKYLLGSSLAMEERPVVKKAKPDIAPQPVEKKPPEPELALKILKSLFCPNCGSKVEADAVFCGKCGKRVINRDFL